MNKVLCFLFIVFVICIGCAVHQGCSASFGTKGKKENNEETRGFFQKASWEGHDYILYNGVGGKGLTHDPDCPCNSSEEDLTVSAYQKTVMED